MTIEIREGRIHRESFKELRKAADIMVKPEFQGKGIGSRIMDSIMAYLNENVPQNSYITPMAARGKESFFEKFGFFGGPTEKYGHAMTLELR